MAYSFDILRKKLDGFIRRYYLNQLIKGGLLFGIAMISVFLLFVLVEHFGYLSSNFRLVLFYSYVLINIIILIKYVLFPLLGMIKIGRRISDEQAAQILEKFYGDQISDKVTNVLQLKRYLNEHPENAALIEAGVEQKAKQVNILPFRNAIPIRGNYRFVPFLLIPALFFAVFYLFFPAIILEPAKRIVQYEVTFERPKPFNLVLASEQRGFKGEEYEVLTEVVGDMVPAHANVVINNNRYRMKQLSNRRFSYVINNVQDDLKITLEAEGYRFGPFHINIDEKATINHFHILVTPPEYTQLPEDEFTNMGDLSVIRGSDITWRFFTNREGIAEVAILDTVYGTRKVRDGEHVFQIEAQKPFDYTVYALDDVFGRGDSLNYHINVVQDQHPRIAVEEHRDEVLLAHLFYRGTITDDFGFSGLRFNYRVMDPQQVSRGDDVPFMREDISIDKDILNQGFYHYFDLNTVYVQPGETVEAYFEVFDNDPVDGPKSARSRLFSYYIPTREEILADRRKSEEKIEEGLSDGLGDIQSARDEIDELRRNLLETERIGWEERETVQEIIKRREELEQQMKNLSDIKKEAETRSEQFLDANEHIKKKQEELQKLFDEVMTDELKMLFDQIREELDNISRDEIYEMLDKMDFELSHMELQLDRALEMFRQFAMERLLDESIDRLQELSEEQAALSEETKEAEDAGDVSEKQKNIEDAFEKVKEIMEEFRKTNEQLSRPHQLEDTKQEENAISEDLKEALEQLQMENMQQATPFQQDAGQKMENMADALQQMQQQMFEKKLAEDARAIRMLLENLLRSSFAQEDLIMATRQANVNDPGFVHLIRDQRKIQSDMEMIKDSLVALSKRQMAIHSFVNREINEININLSEGIHHMINRRRHQSATRQQLVMTHINNLALLLNESLQDMMQQMAMGAGMGEGMEEGGVGQSFESLREMQEKLNEMLQQMRDGHDPMPGGEGETPMSFSEQMARMAAEQEAIRNKLREMADQMRSEGLDGDRALEELQREMERSELDMLRKELSQQTMMRQERILTRLLEHERAEKERETEERREGIMAEDYEISNPEDIFEYNRLREREMEMLRTLPPGLRPFYRTLVEQYFLHVD